eukprot:scaffold1147_cov172-Amphora_coffeaeformis.AAC.14
MDRSQGSSSKREVAEAVPKEPIVNAAHPTKSEESDSYLSAPSDGGKKRKRVRSKKPKDMPRRPLSAYNLFFKEQRGRLQGEPQARKKSKFGFEELGKKIGALWKQLGPQEKQIYQDQAKVEMGRYQKEMEQYQSNLNKKAGVPDEEESLNFSDGLYVKEQSASPTVAAKSVGGAMQDSGNLSLAEASLHADRSKSTGDSHMPGMGLGGQQLYSMAMQHSIFPQQNSFPLQTAQFARERFSYWQQVGSSESMPDGRNQYPAMALPHLSQTQADLNAASIPLPHPFCSEFTLQSQYLSNIRQGMGGVSQALTNDNPCLHSMQQAGDFGDLGIPTQVPPLPESHQFNSSQHQVDMFQPSPIELPLNMGFSTSIQQPFPPPGPVPFPFDETVGERNREDSSQGGRNDINFDFSIMQQLGQYSNQEGSPPSTSPTSYIS